MKNIILSLANSTKLARSIAKQSHSEYSEIFTSKFPDEETYLRFMKPVKGKNVFIVSSTQPNPNNSLIELFLAINNAKDLGARKVIVFLPYFPYIRQDARFKSGESISSKTIAKLLSYADGITTVDPHLHRIKDLSKICKTRTKVLHTAQSLADFIKPRFKDHLLIGPDSESRQWVSAIAEKTNSKFIVLSKKRLSSRKVKISLPNYPLKNKNVVIIDDVVSSGGTIIEATGLLKKKGVKSISLVCVHGIFAENAISKMKKAGVKDIVCTNTLQTKQSKINISSLFAQLIKK